MREGLVNTGTKTKRQRQSAFLKALLRGQKFCFVLPVPLVEPCLHLFKEKTYSHLCVHLHIFCFAFHRHASRLVTQSIIVFTYFEQILHTAVLCLVLWLFNGNIL